MRSPKPAARSSLFWGGLNTAVLIGSSLTMAMAVRGAQTNKRKATVNWLILTMILGAVFLGVKVIEYQDKFEHHHVPGPNFDWRRTSSTRPPPASMAPPRRPKASIAS